MRDEKKAEYKNTNEKMNHDKISNNSAIGIIETGVKTLINGVNTGTDNKND